MKKMLLTGVAIALFAACNNKEKTEAEIQKARQATLDSVNMANARQRTLDSLTAVSNSAGDEIIIETPTLAPEPEKPSPKRSNAPKKNPTANTPKTNQDAPVATNPTVNNTPSTGGTVASSPEGGTAGTGTTASTEEKKKKGLNNAAKGAIIGLGTGAAAGAILNKENRGKGAVIGGVVGAVGGAVGGAVLDKRKAKKEAEKDSTNKK